MQEIWHKIQPLGIKIEFYIFQLDEQINVMKKSCFWAISMIPSTFLLSERWKFSNFCVHAATIKIYQLPVPSWLSSFLYPCRAEMWLLLLCSSCVYQCEAGWPNQISSTLSMTHTCLSSWQAYLNELFLSILICNGQLEKDWCCAAAYSPIIVISGL